MATVTTRSDGAGQPPHRPERPAKPPSGRPRGDRRRSILRGLRTFVVVVALLAGATAGGVYIVRQRMADRAFIDLGRTVLTAEAVPVGAADAGVVAQVMVAQQDRVTAGQDLAKVTLTANGTSRTPQTQTLRAPVAGTVSVVNVAAGSVARAGEPVITLYDQSKITFQAKVPVSQLRRLRLGMTAAITGSGLSRAATASLDRVVAHLGTDQLPTNARLTVVLVPQPADVATVGKLVPGLPFKAVIDTRTAVGGTPAISSA